MSGRVVYATKEWAAGVAKDASRRGRRWLYRWKGVTPPRGPRGRPGGAAAKTGATRRSRVVASAKMIGAVRDAAGKALAWRRTRPRPADGALCHEGVGVAPRAAWGLPRVGCHRGPTMGTEHGRFATAMEAAPGSCGGAGRIGPRGVDRSGCAGGRLHVARGDRLRLHDDHPLGAVRGVRSGAARKIAPELRGDDPPRAARRECFGLRGVISVRLRDEKPPGLRGMIL